MLVLSLLVTLLLTWQCWGVELFCRKPDGGCCYPTVPQPETQTKCPPLDFWQDGTVGWSVEPSGSLNITFVLPRVNCLNVTCFDILLLVDDTVSEEHCGAKNTEMSRGRTGNIPREREFMHSLKQYTINNGCDLGKSGYYTCEATRQLSFNFVFSGCYQVAFQPKINTSSRRTIYSPRKYLHTNFVKKLISGPRYPNLQWMNVTDQYYPASKTLAITFPIGRHSRRYRMLLNQDIWYMECNHTARECSPPPQRPAKHPPAECIVSNGSISCSFSEVGPGDYCFTMHVDSDDRCVPNTLWTIPKNREVDCPPINPNCSLFCSWQHNFTVEEITFIREATENELDSTHVYIIMATVLAVVVVVTAVFLVVLKAHTKRFFQRTARPVLTSSAMPMEQSRIFLLYARDCPPFMELMATLRELLEGATKSEVIDCLDPSRWNDIGRSPVEWVRGHIEHPNTKVMLVATPCGHLRQQAHLNHTVTYYKTPETYDNLFTYGLKTLADNLSQDIYRKICVVRFEGFSDDGNLFSHLTPYTRFVLPLHLQQLILTLQPSVTAEEDGNLLESKEVQKLCQDLTNLTNYKNTNINYLQEMLVVQRNEVT